MKFELRQFLVYRLPVIAWAVLLFFLSSIPSASLPKLALEAKDLILHFGAYAVFGVLLSHAVIQRLDRLSSGSGLLVIIIGTLYGISDELHQIFVPGRQCAFSDFLADCAGLVFGLFLYLSLLRLFRSVVGEARE